MFCTPLWIIAWWQIAGVVVAQQLLSGDGDEGETHLDAADFARAEQMAAAGGGNLLEASRAQGQDQEGSLYNPELIEGDIKRIAPGLLGHASGSRPALASEGPPLASIQRNALADRAGLWPNPRRIPYAISTRYTAFGRAQIASAFAQYERHTCVRFAPKKFTDKAYLRIVPEHGCYSTVGMEGGPQLVSLGDGCLTTGIIMHELMHSLGFFHEQSRYDRDSYVTVNWHNIQADLIDQFGKYNRSVIDTLGMRYDYASILHYGPYAFTANGLPTIEPRSVGATIGQRQGFSATDVRKINKLYRCDGAQSTGGQLLLSTLTPFPTVVQPTPEPSGPSLRCGDQLPALCATMRSHCGTHEIWMRARCAKTCGYCPKLVGKKCKDERSVCPSLASVGFCARTYADWMRAYCPKSCGLCDKGRPSAGRCTDAGGAAECGRLAALGQCASNAGYMVLACRLACGFCTAQPAAGKVAKPPPPLYTAESAESDCKNARDDCDVLKAKLGCRNPADSALGDFMQTNCRQACKLCT